MTMTVTEGLASGRPVRVVDPISGVDRHHPTDRLTVERLLDPTDDDPQVHVTVRDLHGQHVETRAWPPDWVRPLPVEQGLPGGPTLDEVLHRTATAMHSAPAIPAVRLSGLHREALGAVAALSDAWDHHSHALEEDLERARRVAAGLEQENARLRDLAQDVVDGKPGGVYALSDYLASEHEHAGERVERP